MEDSDIAFTESDLSQCKADDRQLLVDVSTLVHVDDGSGIQRVVWNILKNLLHTSPPGFSVRPVYRNRGSYKYANQFVAQMTSSENALADRHVSIQEGDVFLGLDFDHKFDIRAQRFLQRQQKEQGLLVYFVVYDLLAVTHPEWFNQHLASIIKKWLKRIVAVADGLVCISESVAGELKEYLVEKGSNKGVEVGFFHLGADICVQDKGEGLTLEERQIIKWLKGQVVFFMIGTLEPRKGHAQVLDAMTGLWKGKEDVLLVVAGKQGWKVDRIVKRINEHPENGEHLFWFENVSDAFLLQLYSVSSALIMASEGEGFGLPLIEAAQHQLPIITRDLQVFREVAGDNAFYFSGITGRELQRSLSDWLKLYCKNKHPGSENMQWKTWAQSSGQLLNVVLMQKWI